MAKGIFSKFFEEVPSTRIDPSGDYSFMAIDEGNYNYEEPTSSFENAVVPEVISDQLIENTYAENELSDTSKSILKVEMLTNTLPVEMPNDVKRNTVLGILKVSGISEDEVVVDAYKRIEVLNAVKTKISSENESKIGEATNKIEQLKAEIESLNAIIYETNNENAQVGDTISKEIERITTLENFIKLSGGK